MNKAERLRIPAEIATAALVAYLLGYWFTDLFPGYLPKIGGLWSAISAIVVTQATPSVVRHNIRKRVFPGLLYELVIAV